MMRRCSNMNEILGPEKHEQHIADALQMVMHEGLLGVLHFQLLFSQIARHETRWLSTNGKSGSLMSC